MNSKLPAPAWHPDEDIRWYNCACGGLQMRTTVALDDELVAKAQALTGLQEMSSLVREALKALIERESARRLARLGGTEPGLKAPARRRPQAKISRAR
jgi:Arc/MetJ family transcription regulator